jgi:hypothetical protein
VFEVLKHSGSDKKIALDDTRARIEPYDPGGYSQGWLLSHLSVLGLTVGPNKLATVAAEL